MIKTKKSWFCLKNGFIDIFEEDHDFLQPWLNISEFHVFIWAWLRLAMRWLVHVFVCMFLCPCLCVHEFECHEFVVHVITCFGLRYRFMSQFSWTGPYEAGWPRPSTTSSRNAVPSTSATTVKNCMVKRPLTSRVKYKILNWSLLDWTGLDRDECQNDYWKF